MTLNPTKQQSLFILKRLSLFEKKTYKKICRCLECICTASFTQLQKDPFEKLNVDKRHMSRNDV